MTSLTFKWHTCAMHCGNMATLTTPVFLFIFSTVNTNTFSLLSPKTVVILEYTSGVKCFNHSYRVSLVLFVCLHASICAHAQTKETTEITFLSREYSQCTIYIDIYSILFGTVILYCESTMYLTVR